MPQPVEVDEQAAGALDQDVVACLGQAADSARVLADRRQLRPGPNRRRDRRHRVAQPDSLADIGDPGQPADHVDVPASAVGTGLDRLVDRHRPAPRAASLTRTPRITGAPDSSTITPATASPARSSRMSWR